MQFFLEVLIGGLLSGVMYSLVAIGFVLIYKTSGVLNFAQGAMLLFAALTFVSLVERGLSLLAGFPGDLGDHGADWDSDRTRCPAAAHEQAADHALHGDAWVVLY